MQYMLLNPGDSSWPARVDEVCAQLGAPANPALFPPQFLHVTLPKIGGQIVVGEEGSDLVCAGFLFPRAVQAGKREYTLRFHQVGTHTADPLSLVDAVQAALNCGKITLYDPSAPQEYQATHAVIGAFDIGAPDADEAAAVREMQRHIWGATVGYLYPSDIHSLGFCPGTSLVGRAEGKPVGFTFGFWRFGNESTPAWAVGHRTDLRIESQTLGVLPEARQGGLGFLLKRRQAELALESGIDIIHWTVDPLQFANGVLNFNKLGGVAFDFYPSYYPFRNALNQLPASRFNITWPLRSGRVAERLATRRRVLELADFGAVQVLNHGPVAANELVTTSKVAIEIPVDWTTLQARDLAQAARWRKTTDALLEDIVGFEPGKYGITDVATAGERRYLIGCRVDELSTTLAMGWR